MAAPNHLFFPTLLILASLFASISVEAREVRERESFSKFTNANNNVDKENTRVAPNKEEALTTEEALKKQENQEQEPTFLPQTQNGYGLYGHEEVFENTPATTTTTTTSTGNRPSRTVMPDDSFYSYPKGNFQNSLNYYNDRSYDSRSDNSFNKDAYVTGRREQARNTYMPEEQNFGGNTRLQDSSYAAATTGSRATNDRNNYYTGGNRYGAVNQEGMSDTRFMENGKYFYDVDNEEKYYQNRYERSKPRYSTQGYYGSRNRNDNVNFYDQQFNNVHDNSMGGYQEQFQESQDDEFVP